MRNKHELFERAEAIQERRASGFWEPVLWHLALRKHGPSLLRLADWNTRQGHRRELGKVADAFSPLGMMYRAFKSGESCAGINLAITYFNVGDLGGYRFWLARAVKANEPDAKEELHRFEMRKPHRLASRVRRLRPFHRDGS